MIGDWYTSTQRFAQIILMSTFSETSSGALDWDHDHAWTVHSFFRLSFIVYWYVSQGLPSSTRLMSVINEFLSALILAKDLLFFFHEYFLVLLSLSVKREGIRLPRQLNCRSDISSGQVDFFVHFIVTGNDRAIHGHGGGAADFW